MQLNILLSNIVNFTKRRLIELFGLSLIAFFLIFTFTLVKYSPENATFIYNSDGSNVSNIFNYYSNSIADFFLQSFGLMSFLIGICFFSWGINLLVNKKIDKILAKSFYLCASLLSGCLFIYSSFNNSFWLIDNGNSGFIGERSFSLLSNFFPIVENEYFKYSFLFLALGFFILGSSININRILSFLLRKKDTYQNKETRIEDDLEQSIVQNESLDQEKQQTFSFQNINNSKTAEYRTPSLTLLEKNKNSTLIKSNSKNIEPDFLEKILIDFGVQGKIKKISNGPVVTLYEFEPAPGVKVAKIISLSDDIARHTSSISTRVSVIPGKNTVGIEIPNSKRDDVFLSEIISSDNFNKKDINLPIALGKTISGIPITVDLTSMPHLLVAGTTGSGKSVCINSIIMSLLFKHSPENCKFILIDPKMLELSSYEGIPHLLTSVITDAKKATSALSWTVKEMESRYRLMSSEGVKNIDGYNQKHKLKMPYIVVVVDEMSDLMLVSGKEIEGYVQKLSAMARAAGIHIIMATQRPSVDVITGTIKANFPTRISFQVSSKIDSKTVLGEQGAEQLLGKGDMLFMSSANKIFRIHGPYVSENEIEKVNSFLRSQGNPDYIDEITTIRNSEKFENLSGDGNDELYETAVKIVQSERKASTSFLQRKLQIGYNRAARIVDQMEENGVVSKANHVGKREVL
jgi:S-DNA-T family DNA segregation ATPase FtsK/SpoIIIE